MGVPMHPAAAFDVLAVIDFLRELRYSVKKDLRRNRFMNPWLVIFLVALALVACLMIFYAILSAIVISVAKRHGEKIFQQYTEEMEQLLPGKNCGKCGCANCYEYARKLVRGEEEDITLCTEGGDEVTEKLQARIDDLSQLLAPPEKLENPDLRERESV